MEKRYKVTGTLVAGFGLVIDGVVTSNPSANWEEIKELVVDSDYLYVAGVDNELGGGDSQWRIEKLDKISGTLVAGFGLAEDGILTSNPGVGFSDEIFGLAADSEYLYLCGSENLDGSNDNHWRIEKRDKVSGTLVADFGITEAGVVTSNLSAYDDAATRITVDDDYIYICGYVCLDDSSDYEWRIEKRDKTTGALIGTFGVAGAVETNYDTDTDKPCGIINDSNYIYICGDVTGDYYEWCLEKRIKSTGGQ